MINIPTYLIFIVSFLSISAIVMGIIAVAKNHNSAVNRLFCAFSVTLSLWVICSFLENWFYNIKISIFFLNADFFLGAFVFFFAFLFLFNFPQENKKVNGYAFLFLIPTIINIYFLMNGGIVTDVSLIEGRAVFVKGDWFWFYALIGVVSVFSGIIYQFIQYKKSFGIKREQIRYVIFGMLICATIILSFNLFLQNLISGEIIMLSNSSLAILIFCIFYAIIRYHLMDIWVVLRLGTVFTLLLSSITFIYVLASYFLIGFLGIGRPWSYIIPSFIITISFIPLKNLIELATDKIFFKKHYKFSKVINQIEESIHEAGLDLDKTLEIVNRIITLALKVGHGAILILIPKDHFISRQTIGANLTNLKLKQDNPIINYLNAYKGRILDREYLEREAYDGQLSEASAKELERELAKDDIALAVPIEFKEKMIGVYLLGPKLSQDAFTAEDFRLLQHVAWEISFAIDNAKSYEELKRLDEAKSNFISVVSHQLRTPVTVSRCNLELYFDADSSPIEKDEAIKAAYEGTLSLGRQLDQLITVLEIEEKNVVLRKSPVKIKALLEEVVNNNKVNIKNKNIHLDVNVKEPLPEINCDESRIKKVLDILLVNATSYVFAEGRIEISIKKETFNKKDKLVVAIADNGVGIREDSRSELFKKFFRGPEAISMSPNGFGLGLFIAKKIIRAHGGEIWVDSKEERGTAFYFSLPIR